MSLRSMIGGADSERTGDMKVTLSTLWIFAILNYIYADVFTAMDPAASGGSIRKSHGMMLGAAILMETAMVMVPLSRFLKYQANRWTNIVTGIIHTAAVILSLFVGGKATPSYYLVFASVEVVSTLLIIGCAWKWSPGPSGTARTEMDGR